MTRQFPNRRTIILFVTVIPVCALLFLISSISTNADSNGNYALDFDGTTDMVRLHETSTMMITPTWTTTKSVTLWVRPESSSTCTNPLAVAHCDNILGDRARFWGISIGYSSFPDQDRIWVWNSQGTPPMEDKIGVEYNLGEWVHIALVHGNGVLRAYKNGVEVGNTPSGQTQQPNTGAQPVLYLGGIINNASRNWTFDGQLDEVRIWESALSAADVRRDMYNTLPAGEPGLAAYYSMSDGSGTSLTDNSGNGWTGTFLDGGTGVPPNGSFAQWIASGALTGPRNTLDFDGSDDFVDLVDNGNIIIGAGWAGTKSVDVWLQSTGAAPPVADASLGDVVVGGTDWGISQANVGGQDRLWVWNDDGAGLDSIGLSYSSNEWTQITLVHDGGNLTAYQDGQLVGTVASGSTNSDSTLTIGGLGSGQNFQGQIDEVRIWDDARSAIEVQDNVYQTVEFDAAGLAAYYRFDQDNEAGQTEVVDSTDNGRHGTMTNMDPGADWMASTAFNTWVGSNTIAWADSENWSRYGLYNERVGITNYPAAFAATVTSTVVADEVIVETGAALSISGTLQMNDRLVGDSVTVNAGGLLEMLPGSVITIHNVLTNNGTLSQTKSIDGSTAVSYFDTGGYGGLTIDPNGQNMGATTIMIRGNQDCEGGMMAVWRCFDIAPTTNPMPGADLTFYFHDSELNGNSCLSLNVYHWNGASWDELTPSSVNCAPALNSITVDNVTAFSPFVLANITPTAVTLHQISAENSANYVLLLPIVLLLLLTGIVLAKRFNKKDDSFVV